MRVTGKLLVVLLAVSVGTLLLLRATEPTTQAQPATVEALAQRPAAQPTCVIVQQLDEQGRVVATYEVERYERGPVGILAFVTTDGRRLFLDDHQWRITNQP